LLLLLLLLLAPHRASVALDGPPSNAQALQLGHQLKGELGTLPVLCSRREAADEMVGTLT
jgi:hypothetical protein